MKKALFGLLAMALLLVSTEAKAWLVPCDSNDLPRCQTACTNAGGEIITNPYDNSKWCKIPYRVSGGNTSDPRASVLEEGGMDLRKGRAQFPAAPRSVAQPSSE